MFETAMYYECELYALTLTGLFEEHIMTKGLDVSKNFAILFT